MEKVFIGLDPGAKGFITVFNPQNNEYKFYQMPTEKVDGKQVFSFTGLKDLIFEIREDFKGMCLHVVIEEVIGRQGWSAQNNFNFGYVAGAQRMLFELLKANIVFVRPQKWQAIMYQGFDKVKVPSSTGKTMIHDTKATSAVVAQSMRPDIDFRRTTRSKNIDDNKTDSFLLAMYSYKCFLKS